MVAWKNSSKGVEGEVVSCCKMTHGMLGLEVNILDTEKGNANLNEDYLEVWEEYKTGTMKCVEVSFLN